MAIETDNRVLVAYLFGELSEAEQSRIEELCFTDDSVYEQITIIENDLIDCYVQNTLTVSDRRKFEEKYLITPGRRKRVAESEKLINLIISYPSDSSNSSWWKSLLAFLDNKHVIMQYSMTAALLALILGCVWLIRDRARLNRQVEETNTALRQNEAESQREAEARRKASEELQEDLRNTQAQREQDAQLLRELQEKMQQAREIRPSEKPPPSPGTVSVATYIFPLVSVRGGLSQKQLLIRAGENSVRLVIYLKNNSYKQYRVSIQRVSGEEVWSHIIPKGKSRAAGERVSFELPASVFEKKDYVLAIDATKPDGSIENLDTRAFSVVNNNIQR